MAVAMAISHSTFERHLVSASVLMSQAGLLTMADAKPLSLAALTRIVGPVCAALLHSLCRGRDPGRVVPSGPPQSMSEEDIVLSCRSSAALQARLAPMVASLLRRAADEQQQRGRLPRTLRLMVRPATRPYAQGARSRY